MKVFMFVGPTLPREEVRSVLDAICLPPVAQGDVYRAAREKPFAIGIIDGYFEQLPAVWHKEILWAMSQRIHVFGAASMGALRAAELGAFGMRGIGEIYRAFASGELEDDDEVAVAHGDASTGFRPLSDAMVNIRATLAEAQKVGAIGPEVSARLIQLAKDTFYPERCYQRLLCRGREEGLPEEELQALAALVRSGGVDQKRLDAKALLVAVRECCLAGVAPESPAFTFQHTEAWDQVAEWADSQPPLSLEATAVSADLVASEVRLLGVKGDEILAAGYARLAAELLARRRPVPDVKDRIAKLGSAFQKQVAAGHVPSEGGDAPDDEWFGRWLEEQGLTRESYPGLLERQVELNWLKERYRSEVGRYVVDELRYRGEYAQVARRAFNKEQLLTRCGMADPTLRDVELTQSELFEWYFEGRLGRLIPADVGGWLLDCGFASAAVAEREALRELVYVRLRGGKDSEDANHGSYQGSP